MQIIVELCETALDAAMAQEEKEREGWKLLQGLPAIRMDKVQVYDRAAQSGDLLVSRRHHCVLIFQK